MLYNLCGNQVQPDAGYWAQSKCANLCVLTNEDFAMLSQDLPDFPAVGSPEEAAELQELQDLEIIRDNLAQVSSTTPGRERAPISAFLQLRPQPLGAVYNSLRGPDQPVIQTGRELARYFENETPGLAHHLALYYLLPLSGFSPPRQARVWAALSVAISSALLAAWYAKWFIPRPAVRYRPRPVERQPNLNVLYDRAVNSTGSGDGPLRGGPLPSPGTPRHPSYPAGHSTYAAAASEILCYFFPGSKVDLDHLTDNIGLARMWAGIHYRSDHEYGVMLGRAVARHIIEKQLMPACIDPVAPACGDGPDDSPEESAAPPPPPQGPPTYEKLQAEADVRANCCEEARDGTPIPAPVQLYAPELPLTYQTDQRR